MSTVEQQELKQLVNEAIREIMLENSEVLKDLLAEVLEETALRQRMDEGRNTEFVNRYRIMELLEPKS